MSKPQFSYAVLLDLQNHACFYCNRKLAPIGYCYTTARTGYTRDHFFPRSWGNGLYGNIVLSCRKCNAKKNNLLPTREEIFRFVKLWENIRGGHTLNLEEFFYTQRLIDLCHKLVGPVVDRKNII